MDTIERLKVLRRELHQAEEVATNTLTDALAETYKAVTGRKPSERLWEKLYDAVRFER